MVTEGPESLVEFGRDAKEVRPSPLCLVVSSKDTPTKLRAGAATGGRAEGAASIVTMTWMEAQGTLAAVAWDADMSLWS